MNTLIPFSIPKEFSQHKRLGEWYNNGVREKIFLFIWIASCTFFYSSLDAGTFSFVFPRFPLKLPLLCLLGGSLALLISKKRIRFFSHPLFVFPIPLLGITLFFLVKFPLGNFSSLDFQDDFTSLYAASLRTLRMLQEGTLFG